jgi:hypothetical protein
MMAIGYHPPIGGRVTTNWYELAREDADRRGIEALKPLIDTLRDAARQLREADWNENFGARGPEADEDARIRQRGPADTHS